MVSARSPNVQVKAWVLKERLSDRFISTLCGYGFPEHLAHRIWLCFIVLRYVWMYFTLFNISRLPSFEVHIFESGLVGPEGFSQCQVGIWRCRGDVGTGRGGKLGLQDFSTFIYIHLWFQAKLAKVQNGRETYYPDHPYPDHPYPDPSWSPDLSRWIGTIVLPNVFLVSDWTKCFGLWNPCVLGQLFWGGCWAVHGCPVETQGHLISWMHWLLPEWARLALLQSRQKLLEVARSSRGPLVQEVAEEVHTAESQTLKAVLLANRAQAHLKLQHWEPWQLCHSVLVFS